MKKIILEDNSTCCSHCFEMLSAGIEVFVDKDNEVVCSECYQETEQITTTIKKLEYKLQNPYNSCEKVLFCKETKQYYILQNGLNKADKVLTTCYPSGGFYEADTPVKEGLKYEIEGKEVTTLEGGVIRDGDVYEAWQNEELELYKVKEEYKDFDDRFKETLLISLHDYMDENHFEKINVKRKEVFRLHDYYYFI